MMSKHSAEPQTSPFPWFSLYFSTQCSRIRFLLIKKCFSGHATPCPVICRATGDGQEGLLVADPHPEHSTMALGSSQPSPLPLPWSHPRVHQAAGTARGPHLPCSAPGARRVPPDTQERTRGSGNRQRSSTLEERETLWLHQERCQLPKPPPGTTPDPLLPHTCSRHAGCQHAPGCSCRCWGSCRHLIPQDTRISSSLSLSSPAPSPMRRNCCLSQHGFQITG